MTGPPFSGPGPFGAPGPVPGPPPGVPPYGAGPPGAPGAARPRPIAPLSLGAAICGGAGLLLIVFSFLPFVRYVAGTDGDGGALFAEFVEEGIPTSWNAWSGNTFMAPLSTSVALAGVLLVGLTVLVVLRPATTVLRFTVGQLLVAVSLHAFLVMLGYALSARTLVFGDDLNTLYGGSTLEIDLGAGAWLLLVCALVAVVGAVLAQLGVGPAIVLGRGGPPSVRPGPRPH